MIRPTTLHRFSPDELPDPVSPMGRLLIVLGSVLLGNVLGILIGAAIAAGIWGQDINTIPFVLQNPTHYPFARQFILLLQGVTHILAFTLGPLLLLAVTVPRAAFWAWLRARLQLGPVVGMLGAAAVLIACIPALSRIVDWNQHIELGGALAGFGEWARAKEEGMRVLTELLTRQRTLSELFFSLLVIALLPAIGEEITFRGIIQPTIGRWMGSRTAGIWIGAVLFSAIHMQFFGLIPRLLLGAAFGYLYAWSGRLWVPMAAHFVNNGLQIVLLYLFQHGHVSYDVGRDEPMSWFLVVPSVLLTAALLWWLRRYLRARAEPLTAALPSASRPRAIALADSDPL